MTTDSEMAKPYADQEEVIAGLRAISDHNLADRVERCAAVRREPRHGDGWPRVCRRPMIRSGWNGMRYWTPEATSSLAIIPLRSSAGLPDALRRLRRGLRDTRDRMARRRRSWREVCFAGMIGGDGNALVLVTHDGVDQGEVLDALRRRWPDVVVKGLEHEQPAVAMTAEDAADLGRCRRGVEPLRAVIMPQYDRQVALPVLA